VVRCICCVFGDVGLFVRSVVDVLNFWYLCMFFFISVYFWSAVIGCVEDSVVDGADIDFGAVG